MNFPFYLYPNQLLSGYTDYELYLKETQRLYNDLLNYKPKTNTLFQLIIGAVMEEAIDYNIQLKEHWRQLFPYYLENYLETCNESNVDIFIISPNIGFKNHIEPTFIKKTSYYQWKYDIDTKTYHSTNENVKVHIYYTPFPSIDIYNSKIIKIYEEIMESSDIKKIIQTDQDCKFINKFYQELENKFTLIEQNNGFVICNSYAVFRFNSIFYRKYRNFGLFPNILTLFKNKTNRILLEWKFKDDNYDMYSPFLNKQITYSGSGIIPIFYNFNYETKIKYLSIHNFILE